MKLFKFLALALGLAVSAPSFAGMTTDRHGNVGYDTMAECQTAINQGQAKFYESFTRKPATLLNGAVSTHKTTLRQVLGGSPSIKGYCDKGVGRKQGRDGVTRALQGKYIPYDADFAVNAYRNKAGEIFNVRMEMCDNWFDGNFMPVGAPQAAAPAVVAPPVVMPPQAPVATVPAATVPSVSAIKPWWWLVPAAIVGGVLLGTSGGDDDTTATTTTTAP